ncbi:hypothetical protein SNK04_012987 [Fusarium graminearum]
MTISLFCLQSTLSTQRILTSSYSTPSEVISPSSTRAPRFLRSAIVLVVHLGVSSIIEDAYDSYTYTDISPGFFPNVAIVSGVRPSILFYNADEIFAHVVTSELEAIQLQHQFATSLTGAPAEWIKVHLLASHRAMQRAIPHDTTVFVDCSDITDSLAAAFVASIPAICTTYRVGSGLMSTALETAKFSGVCNAAMVLKDGFFIDMDADQLNNTLAAEVLGTEQLDSIFHDTNLDFFICLVSVASVIGNVGQSNYHAANLFMDSLIN